jgi:hypothetical protein
MQWLYNKLCSHQFYKITRDGDQLSMMDNTPFEYILHIQNDGKLRYHFMKENYVLTHPYSVLGMSITIQNKQYILPSEQFIIQDNELFNETMTLWLCKHYLYITPCNKSTITILDENADIQICTLLRVQNNLKNDIKCIS